VLTSPYGRGGEGIHSRNGKGKQKDYRIFADKGTLLLEGIVTGTKLGAAHGRGAL